MQNPDSLKKLNSGTESTSERDNLRFFSLFILFRLFDVSLVPVVHPSHTIKVKLFSRGGLKVIFHFRVRDMARTDFLIPALHRAQRYFSFFVRIFLTENIVDLGYCLTSLDITFAICQILQFTPLYKLTNHVTNCNDDVCRH